MHFGYTFSPSFSAVSAGGSLIVLPAIWATGGGYWHSNSLPVGTLNGSDIPTAVPALVGGTALTAVTSPVNHTGVFSNGRRSLATNGTTSYFHANALATAAAGNDLPHCGFLHCVIPTLSAGGLMCLGSTAGSRPAHELRVNATDQLLSRREGDTAGALTETAAPAIVDATEYVIIWSYTGTAYTLWVRSAAGLVKHLDGVSLDVGTATLNTLAIGGSLRNTFAIPLAVDFRVAGWAPTTLTDTQAATIGGLFGR